MKYKNGVDLHSHTNNSRDAKNKVMVMVERADTMGLRAIAITDHCECDCYKSEMYDLSTLQSYIDAVKARTVYEGSFIVACGVELAQPLSDLESAQKVIRRDYDMIVGSQRRSYKNGKSYKRPEEFPGSTDDLINCYLDDLKLNATWGKFDVMAHPEYVFRYLDASDFNAYKDRYDEILKIMADKDIAYEFNTKMIENKVLLDINVYNIKKYTEFGGKYITVGSDAHSVDTVGYGIEEAYDVLRNIGINHIALFQKRLPVLISIE